MTYDPLGASACCCVKRNDFCTHWKKKIGPSLHHRAALCYKLGPVIGSFRAVVDGAFMSCQCLS